jgi:hypothetical protein
MIEKGRKRFQHNLFKKAFKNQLFRKFCIRGRSLKQNPQFISLENPHENPNSLVIPPNKRTKIKQKIHKIKDLLSSVFKSYLTGNEDLQEKHKQLINVLEKGKKKVFFWSLDYWAPVKHTSKYPHKKGQYHVFPNN